MSEEQGRHFLKNLLVLGASVILAVVLAKSGVFEKLLIASAELKFIGSFVAGLFFTSLFTVAPATVALAEIAQSAPIGLVALLGGSGAVIGDLLLFKFLKSRLGDDLISLLKHARGRRLAALFNSPVLRSLSWVLGAAVIASPLPDELGLFLMGLSALKTKYLIPLSFILNSLGIFAVGLVSRGIS